MKELFDEWLFVDDINLQIREFKDWIALASGLPGTQCSSSGGCLGTTFSIEPDGVVYTCDKFVGDARFKLGNITEIEFDNIASLSTFCLLKSLNEDLPDSCINCEWSCSCAGGCCHDRNLQEQLKNPVSESECRFAELLKHVRNRLKDHPSIQAVVKRNSFGPQKFSCTSSTNA